LRFLSSALAALALAPLAACAGGPSPQVEEAFTHPGGAVFDPAIDANSAVDAALVQAGEQDRLVLLVMGANWCHDSRALASYLQQDANAQLLDAHFVPVYINVGLPQTGDGHNLAIATRFGVEIEGTPNMLVIDADGSMLNGAEDAHSWRTAEARGPLEVEAWLQGWITAKNP
jgi:thiol-disulfide isomerase/thioredoxin